MKTRIISAIIALVIFLPCLLLSNTIIFDILIALLSTIAIGEILKCIGHLKHLTVSIPSILIAAVFPFMARQFDMGISISEFALIIFFIFLFWLLSASVFSKSKLPIIDMSVLFTMVLYIVFGFTCILALRNLNNGQYIYMFVFISAWLTDTGAYFTGVTMGKHKLIPDVSPKKTIEGAIGGIIVCIMSFLVYGLILQYYFKESPNYILLVITALFMSIASMCGDLIASLIKRHYKIKDFGNIMPGHGGVMDRFDSIVATAPFLYILHFIPAFADKFI